MDADNKNTISFFRALALVLVFVFFWNTASSAIIGGVHDHSPGTGLEAVSNVDQHRNMLPGKSMSVHNHLEECGLASCAIALPELTDSMFELNIGEAGFSEAYSHLISLQWTPPGRPPNPLT